MRKQTDDGPNFGDATTEDQPKTLRDEFAMAALQGLLCALATPEANSAFLEGFTADCMNAEDFAAGCAYRMADAMLAYRAAARQGATT